MAHSANKPLLDLSLIPQASHYVLAFSGGLDSTALLHLLVEHPFFNNRLSAIHVNHGIHQDASLWAAHCQSQCDQLGIHLVTEQVNLADHSEQAARDARYDVFRRRLSGQQCLLTAHHQDDQLETLLFRLQRGTGLHGLCGMPLLATHESFPIYRPLLNCQKTELRELVNAKGWSCIEDPSNEDNRYSRNFIRNRLLPLMQEANAQVKSNLRLTQQNLRQSAALINELVGRDNPISLPATTEPEVLATFLYHWLTSLGIECPSHHRLQQFAADCIKSGQDKNPRMIFSGHLLWYWQNLICCLDAALFEQPFPAQHVQLGRQAVNLHPGLGQLSLTGYTGSPLQLIIKYQQNQEKIALTGHPQRKRLKNLYQEDGIAPWERVVMPCVYWKNQLVAVGNLYKDAGFERHLSDLNTQFEWQSAAFLR